MVGSTHVQRAADHGRYVGIYRIFQPYGPREIPADLRTGLETGGWITVRLAAGRNGVAVVAVAEAGRCGTILVADDDSDARLAVCTVLARAGYATYAAKTGEEALTWAESETPPLAILDICLPGLSGYQVCRDLKDRFGEGLPVICISAVRTESYDRVAALLIGADEFLVKPIAPDELLIRVARLMRRSTPLPSGVTSKLTKRELEVLRLLAEGMLGREIAGQLVISEKTVSTHIDHILTKLDVRSRVQAVALAYRADLIVTPL
jgi:DNA-binding NarL/FixJ family response regulator